MKDIIQKMRHKYSAGITRWRAFKAKQIVKELVEGHATNSILCYRATI